MPRWKLHSRAFPHPQLGATLHPDSSPPLGETRTFCTTDGIVNKNGPTYSILSTTFICFKLRRILSAPLLPLMQILFYNIHRVFLCFNYQSATFSHGIKVLLLIRNSRGSLKHKHIGLYVCWMKLWSLLSVIN